MSGEIPPDRVATRIVLPAPAPPDMRVRVGRKLAGS